VLDKPDTTSFRWLSLLVCSLGFARGARRTLRGDVAMNGDTARWKRAPRLRGALVVLGEATVSLEQR